MEDSEPFQLVLTILSQINTISITDWMYVSALIIGMLILLTGSAFISASEIAFFSLEAKDLEKIEGKEPEKANQLRSILQNSDQLLATILIVNNTVNIGLVLISSLVIDTFEKHISAPAWVLFLIQIIGITTLILIFGEIIPKVYATKRNREMAKLMIKPILVFRKVFSIPSRLLVKISNIFDQKIRIENKNLSVDELSQVHEIVQNEANKQEQKMLNGILEIGQTEVKQIMVPRTDIKGISINTDYNDVIETITKQGVSRIPVYENSIDTIKGVLYIKDLLGFLNDKDVVNPNWKTLIRQPYFVPENKKLDDLLTEFQEKKIHLAIVVDEYGGVEGLVTLEDIIEEIVGDIKDEFDIDEELEYSILGEGKYIFNGKIPLLDVYRILEVEGEEFEEIKGESETIAGLLLEMKGGFPRKGEVIKLQNYVFTIEHIDEKRIHRIKLEVK
ncbi:gliding motility-associated protein GldE [Flavobacteriales bacterium]|nr:gliding motility-associated protein GldE [Flavobacteriales bacterium]